MSEIEEKEPKKDTTMRSAFCEFPVKKENHPGMTEEEICKWFCEKWVQGKESRQAICLYCISENGYHHVHTVYSSDATFRWSQVKKAIPINGDIQYMRGNKKQALAYIRKEGKFEEKGEKIVCEYNIGEIQDNQGMRTDLDRIGAYISEGLTPNEIMAINIKYRKHDKIIRDAYFAKRAAETPFLRNVYVEWHCGESGTGKTYVIQDLIDTYGEENVYFLSDYDSGGLDKYNGEKVLFMDEFRGQIRFNTLLSMLHGYKSQFHARYTNIFGLWTKVYIASVLPPEQVYKKMVSMDDRENDSIKQLFRRIDTVVYHWKDGDTYKEFRQSMTEYTRYEDIKRLSGNQEFFTPSPAEVEQMRMLFAE